jgi:hypothetical protein|tara:strand:- start:489 stop:1406 length:918 start_codon:yes stop_codon:yes gene_type:complete
MIFFKSLQCDFFTKFNMYKYYISPKLLNTDAPKKYAYELIKELSDVHYLLNDNSQDNVQQVYSDFIDNGTVNWQKDILDKTIFILPFGRLLLSIIRKLHINTEFHLHLIINDKSKLKFLDSLSKLERVSIVTQAEALVLIANKEKKNDLYFSFPELNNTDLRTGTVVNLNNKKYCFSFYESLLCLKGNSQLISFLFNMNSLCHKKYTLQKNKNINEHIQTITNFIYPCFESILTMNKEAIYSWNSIDKHSLSFLYLRDIRRINHLEGLIRYKEKSPDFDITSLEPLMLHLKELKSKAQRMSGDTL